MRFLAAFAILSLTLASFQSHAQDSDNDGIPDAVEIQLGLNPAVKDNDVFGNAQLFAMQQYRDFLSREGDPAGITGWTNLITGGTYTRLQVINAFLSSQEFSGFVAPVVRLYFATFLRIPDYAGLTFNAGLVKNGTVTLTQLADFFAASPEFTATYGSLNNTQFVTLLYNNVLGRAPDSAGLNGWVSLLNSGYTRGQVLLGFSDSAEYQAAQANEVFVTMMYAGMLRRTPEPAGFNGWVAFLAAGTYTRTQVINGFFLSAEYHDRFLPPPRVFTIVLENHDYAEIIGSPNAPYINSLIASYGLATNYMDSGTHPSLPNYLYLISGNTQYPGLIDVGPTAPPYFPSAGDNLGNQLQAKGIAWRSYQESMGTPCKLTASGNYNPKSDPFLYFSNIQGSNALCAATNRDYSEFAGDLASATYRYMWISPNLVNSGHDPAADPVAALKASDTWLATEIPKILASPAYQAGGIIFLTWSQAEGRNGDPADQVPMIIISAKIKSAGFRSNHPYSHASYLATVEDIFGLPRLGTAQGADSMMEFFAP
jgi:hypothetical protein